MANPFTASASFNVMNPQDSANNLLSNVVSERNNKRTTFQSGINNAITQAAANVRNQRSVEGAMARQLESEKASQELAKLNKQLTAQNTIAAEERALKRELESSKFMLEAYKEGTALAKEFQDPKLLPSTLELFAGRKMSKGAPFTEQEIEVFAQGTDRTPEQAEMYLTGETPEYQAEPSPELTPESLPGVMNPDGSLTGGVSETVDIPNPTTLYDSLVARVDQIKRDAEADIGTKQSKLNKAKEFKEFLQEEHELKQDIVSNVPIASNSEEYATEESLFKRIDRDIRFELSNEASAKKYSTNRQDYSNTASNQRELIDNLERMDNSLNSAREFGMDFNFNAAKELRAFIGTIGDGDQDAVQEWVTQEKMDNIFTGGENLPEEQRREVITEFLIGLSQLKSKGAALARAGGEVGVLTNEDINRALSQFLAQGANPQVFEANLEDGIAAIVGTNIEAAYKYSNSTNLEVFRRVAQNRGLAYDSDTKTLKPRLNDMYTDFTEEAPLVTPLSPEENFGPINETEDFLEFNSEEDYMNYLRARRGF